MPVFNSSTPNGISLWHIVGRQEGEGTYVYVPSLVSGLQTLTFFQFPQYAPRLTYKLNHLSYSVIPHRVILPSVLSDTVDTLHSSPCRVVMVYRVEPDIVYETVRMFKALMIPIKFHVKRTPHDRIVVEMLDARSSCIDYLERYRYLSMWERLDSFYKTDTPHHIMLGGGRWTGEMEVL